MASGRLLSGSAPGAGNRFLGAAGRSDAVCVRIGKPPDPEKGGVFLRYRSVNQDGIFIEKSKGYELVTEVLHSVAPLYNISKNSRQR